MGNRRTRARANRMQKIMAIILLVCLALSGLAFYVASVTTTNGPTPTPTQQSR